MRKLVAFRQCTPVSGPKCARTFWIVAWGCVRCTATKIVLLELSSGEIRKAIEWRETA